MKVTRTAKIVDSLVYVIDEKHRKDLAEILTNCQNVPNPDLDYKLELEWKIEHKGVLKTVAIPLPDLIPLGTDLSQPIPIPYSEEDWKTPLVLYENQFFLSNRNPLNRNEREEILLRVKKAVFAENLDLLALKKEVANLELADQFKNSKMKREPLQESVKILVWARDGGRCVYCGSQEKLHFDHIIPVSRGGGNDADNLQILCQACNLRKSDKIG